MFAVLMGWLVALVGLFMFAALMGWLVVSAGLFMIAGLYQMTMWAIGKHQNYCREFSNYPRSRHAIVPFIL